MISILETTIRIEAGAELMMYDFKSVLCARACRLPDVGSAFFVLIQNSHSSYYVLKLSARKIRTCTRYRILDVAKTPKSHLFYPTSGLCQQYDSEKLGVLFAPFGYRRWHI